MASVVALTALLRLGRMIRAVQGQREQHRERLEVSRRFEFMGRFSGWVRGGKNGQNLDREARPHRRSKSKGVSDGNSGDLRVSAGRLHQPIDLRGVRILIMGYSVKVSRRREMILMRCPRPPCAPFPTPVSVVTPPGQPCGRAEPVAALAGLALAGMNARG